MSKTQKSSNLGEDLHGAARSGDVVAVQRICCSNPLAINSRDKHSRTPLHLAAWAGQAEVVTYLCKNKANIGASAMDDMDANHFASQKGHLEVVKILVSLGASVKSANRKGMTALHYAVQGSHKELAKYLIKKGASLSTKNKAGKTPLDLSSNEEIRSSLVEFEKQIKRGGLSEKHEAKEIDVKSNSNEKEVAAAGDEEKISERDEPVKRKGDEDCDDDNTLKVKKAKISLNHLLATDDTAAED